MKSIWNDVIVKFNFRNLSYMYFEPIRIVELVRCHCLCTLSRKWRHVLCICKFQLKIIVIYLAESFPYLNLYFKVQRRIRVYNNILFWCSCRFLYLNSCTYLYRELRLLGTWAPRVKLKFSFTLRNTSLVLETHKYQQPDRAVYHRYSWVSGYVRVP